MVAFVDADRPVVDRAQRLEELSLGVLGVLLDRPHVLSPRVLVPPRRLRVVHQVADVDNLVGLVLTDESNDGLHRLTVLVWHLAIADNHNAAGHFLSLLRIASTPSLQTRELTSSPSGMGMIFAFGRFLATTSANSAPALSPSANT